MWKNVICRSNREVAEHRKGRPISINVRAYDPDIKGFAFYLSAHVTVKTALKLHQSLSEQLKDELGVSGRAEELIAALSNYCEEQSTKNRL